MAFSGARPRRLPPFQPVRFGVRFRCMTNWDETLLQADDGVPLLFRWYGLTPTDLSRGTILLTHGLGEHSARYLHVAEFFRQQGYEVASHDLRGHGRSGGRRGDARGFRRFLDDMEVVIREVERRRREREGPLFLYGHSMGGLMVVRFLQERRSDRVAGGVVAAPWIRLAFSPQWWKLALAGMARFVIPGYRQITGLDTTRLSRDRAFAEQLPGKELGHHLISARLFYDIHLSCQSALEEAGHCELPLLLLHGKADPVTSPLATEELFSRLASRDKTLKLYPDMVHELHNDLNREAVLADIAGWLSVHAAR